MTIMRFFKEPKLKYPQILLPSMDIMQWDHLSFDSPQLRNRIDTDVTSQGCGKDHIRHHKGHRYVKCKACNVNVD